MSISKLYRIRYDGQPYWIVGAESLGQAVARWRDHVRHEWGDDYDGTEEPEEVRLFDDGDVVLCDGKALTDSYLRATGHDPEAVGAEMAAFAQEQLRRLR